MSFMQQDNASDGPQPLNPDDEAAVLAEELQLDDIEQEEDAQEEGAK